jgi:RNA polymerase sigma-70 factor (ECF subfamily)
MIWGRGRATNKPAPDSDEALVQRLCEGETEALNALMIRHASALVAFCRCYLDAEAAQDAAQETFVRVLQRCRSMKREMPFKPWLYAIARNVSVSMLRRQRLRAAFSVETLPDAADSPDLAVAEREQREAALRAVDALPPSYRDVLVLHYLSGLTCEETAAALGLKTSAVKMRLRRGELRVREALAQSGMLT